jgi:hypothetical protein
MQYSAVSLLLLLSWFQITNHYTYILVNIESALGFLSPCGCGQCSDHKLTGGRPEGTLSWCHSIPKVFLSSVTSRPAVGPTQPPIQWLPGTVPLRVKRPRHEYDHSSPFSAEVKNDGAVPQLPHTSSRRGA